MKKPVKTFLSPVALFIIISITVAAFYVRYVNFSIDTIVLFLSSKIFLGKWLLRGVLPLYNPQIYLGVPFVFDVGLGNLHPFNLFFVLRYPYSFAVWTGAATLLLLTGFFLFFKQFTKTVWFAVILTLIFFCSGSGLLRVNNPTIYLVIAHYGIFLYSLSFLNGKRKIRYLFPLATGVLLTLSGHIQFVFYGYFLGLLVSLLVYRTHIRRVLLYFGLLFISTSWYYVLSLPLIFQSTRLTLNKNYVNTGNNSIFHYFQLLLPYYLGYVQNGSKWNVGPTYTILTSLFFTFMLGYLLLKKKIEPLYLILLAVLIAASLGFINLPFFRGAGQVTIIIHILGLVVLAKHEDILTGFIRKIGASKWVWLLSVCVLAGVTFFYSDLFRTFFLLVYRIAKHGPPGLFFDNATIRAVGQLIGLSLISVFLFTLSLLVIAKTNKLFAVMTCFVILEGVMFNYFHGFYIPSNILTQRQALPKGIDGKNYRIQTAADVIPYFGVSTYMGDILFRPPFSKEKSVYTSNEQKTLAYLKTIFSFIPSTWVMTTDYMGIQGFDTFIPKKLTEAFSQPSSDFRQVYAYIIARNSLFGSVKDDVSINAIETSQVTLNDPRWQELGVRYFISDRPLGKYKLLGKDGSRYFYENEATKPIYRIEGKSDYRLVSPVYRDPNLMTFDIKKADIGKRLVVNINPDGFIAEMDGKRIASTGNGFNLIVPIKSAGQLKVYYSPVFHLLQVLSSYTKRSPK